MSKVKTWTQEEIDTAKKMMKNGKTYVEIGKVLGRTNNSISAKMIKLGYKQEYPYTYKIGQEIFNIKILKQERRVKDSHGHTSKGYIVLIDGNKETFIWESNLNKINKPYKRNNLIDDSNWLYSEEWMFEFVKNPLDLKFVSRYSSDSTIECVCRHCNSNTTYTAAYLYERGFNCDVCGDTGSFNNRFMKSVLLNNQEEFNDEKTFDGCRNKRKLPFDFYLPNRNIIIEMHGRQHYENVKFFNSSYTTMNNDKIKKKYCEDNHIKLIEIDCSSEDRVTIEDNIKNSELGKFLTISYESFLKFRDNPRNEKLVEMYIKKEPMKNITKEFNICESTVIKRLKRLGVTIRKDNKRKVRCINTGEEFISIKEAREWCNYKSSGGISEACNPDSSKKLAGFHPETKEPLTWEYVD